MLIVWACFCTSVGVVAQTDVQALADSVVKYQMKSGGWPKNQDWLKGADPKVMKECRKTGYGSTIDNGATTSEMEALAKAVNQLDMMMSNPNAWLDVDLVKERKKKYCASFKHGLEFLLKMQYENGGFPQFYPLQPSKAYPAEITFNDNAMVNALKVLRDVAGDSVRFSGMQVDKGLKKRCQAAYERGIQCILNCQIHVDEAGKVLEFDTSTWKMGKRTVWCQQHDKRTLVPAGARSYELPSYSGYGETCAILNLLMDEPKPSAEVKEAIKCGVEWLETHAMNGVAVERFTNADGQKDIRLVEKEGASPLWARFYDLKDAEPMYCDRDGVPRKQLSEIGYERRNGYSWVGTEPQRVIDRYKTLNY